MKKNLYFALKLDYFFLIMLKKFKLDHIDSKILRSLKRDSETSLHNLSEEVGLSKTALHRRISKLKSNKVIRKFTIDIDPNCSALGTMAIVSIIKNKTSSIDIANKLRKISEVTNCYSVTGKVSLMLQIRFNDTAHLQEILEKIQKIDGVEQTITQLVIELHFENNLF